MQFHYVTEMEKVIKFALLNEKVDKAIVLIIKENKQ
jgi:hypothetical protein